ncbi:MAG: hypothetical protein ACK551_02195 [Vampirovibrionales bacterium]
MNEVVNNFLPYLNSNNSNTYNPYQSNDSSYGYDSNTASTQSSYLNLLAGMIGTYANKSNTNGAYTSNNTSFWGAMGGYGGSYSSQPYSFLGNNTSTAYTGNVDSTTDYATDNFLTTGTPATISDQINSDQIKKNNLLLLLGAYFSNKPQPTPQPVVTPEPPVYEQPAPPPTVVTPEPPAPPPPTVVTPEPPAPPPPPVVKPDPPAPKPQPVVKPPSKPQGPVAANEHSAYWGDPHVADADRKDQNKTRANNFTVDGKGTFNLLTDKGVVLNAQHKALPKDKKGNVPWVTGRIDLKLGNEDVILDDKGKPTLNGKALEKDKPITTKDGTVVKWNGSKLETTNVNKGEYNMSFTLNKNTKGKDKNNSYIDTDIRTTAKGVNSDGVMPKGILGEGFDADKDVRKSLKTDKDKYRAPDPKTDAPKSDSKKDGNNDSKGSGKGNSKGSDSKGSSKSSSSKSSGKSDSKSSAPEPSKGSSKSSGKSDSKSSAPAPSKGSSKSSSKGK